MRLRLIVLPRVDNDARRLPYAAACRHTTARARVDGKVGDEAIAGIDSGYPRNGRTFTAGDLLADEYRALIEEIPDLEEDEDFVTEHHTRGWKALGRTLDTGAARRAVDAVSRLTAVNRLKEIMALEGFQDHDPAERKLDAVAKGILRLADRDPRKLIGVIAPNNRVRERYIGKLRSIEVRLDHPPPPIRTFHMGDRGEVAFDEGGILVINAQACKGLEFDTVVLADIDEHHIRHGDPDTARRLFYVMVARAKEQGFMFMKRGEGREIEKLLPADGDMLERRSL